MTCFADAFADPFFLLAAPIRCWLHSSRFWTVSTQALGRKIYYNSTFIGVIWILITLGLEAAGQAVISRASSAKRPLRGLVLRW